MRKALGVAMQMLLQAKWMAGRNKLVLKKNNDERRREEGKEDQARKNADVGTDREGEEVGRCCEGRTQAEQPTCFTIHVRYQMYQSYSLVPSSRLSSQRRRQIGIKLHVARSSSAG